MSVNEKKELEIIKKELNEKKKVMLYYGKQVKMWIHS